MSDGGVLCMVCGVTHGVANRTDNEYDEDGYGNREYFQGIEDFLKETGIVGTSHQVLLGYW